MFFGKSPVLLIYLRTNTFADVFSIRICARNAVPEVPALSTHRFTIGAGFDSVMNLTGPGKRR